MRNRGLIYPKQSGNISHAHIAKRETRDDLQSCGIRKILKVVRKPWKLGFGGQKWQQLIFSALWKHQKLFHKLSLNCVKQASFFIYNNRNNNYYPLQKKLGKTGFWLFLHFKIKKCWKEDFMNSQDILLVLLLSIFANATDTNLNTNTNFLLLLLLALSNGNNFWGCANTCPGQCSGRLF